MDAKLLLEKINGLDAAAQAKAIERFVKNEKSKKTVADYRNSVLSKIFKNCKKLSKQQKETLIYEFLNANADYINKWLLQKHNELHNEQ